MVNFVQLDKEEERESKAFVCVRDVLRLYFLKHLKSAIAKQTWQTYKKIMRIQKYVLLIK